MKTKYFYPLLFFLLLFSSCKDEVSKQRIPYTRVNFYLDLKGGDSSLKNSGEYKIYDKRGLSGIIVVNSPLGIGGHSTEIPDGGGYLYAYDRCCPYEKSPEIKVDVVGNAEAVCPKCKTKYSLLNGGIRLEGVGKQPLQNYAIALKDMNILRYWVYN